jgi:hypothetical protein
MPNQSRSRGGRSGSIRGRRGRGGAPGGNTNHALAAARGPAVPRDQSPDAGQSSRGRRTVRRRSASHRQGEHASDKRTEMPVQAKDDLEWRSGEDNYT